MHHIGACQTLSFSCEHLKLWRLYVTLFPQFPQVHPSSITLHISIAKQILNIIHLLSLWQKSEGKKVITLFNYLALVVHLYHKHLLDSLLLISVNSAMYRQCFCFDRFSSINFSLVILNSLADSHPNSSSSHQNKHRR